HVRIHGLHGPAQSIGHTQRVGVGARHDGHEAQEEIPGSLRVWNVDDQRRLFLRSHLPYVSGHCDHRIPRASLPPQAEALAWSIPLRPEAASHALTNDSDWL